MEQGSHVPDAPYPHMNFLTLNTTTLHGANPATCPRVQLLAHQLSRSRIQLAAIQEARWKKSGVTVVPPYTVYHSAAT
eukprot:7161754-Prorocentrum_lima.AAC.1